MQIMDLIPQMVAQIDAGKFSYRKQHTKTSSSDTQFSDILSAVRTETAGQVKDSNAKNKRVDEKQMPIDAQDTEEPMENGEDEGDDVTAMSALAQSGVVLILEGNMEIDADPDLQSSVEVDFEIAPETVAPVVIDEAIPGQADTQDGEIMEQMARMPETGTLEKPKEEKTEELSDGDLCPFENENEVSEAKGKKDKAPLAAQGIEEKSAEDTEESPERIIPTNQTVDVRPEKLSSAEQLKSAAADRPVTQDNLFDAMVEKIETMQTDGMNQMSIQLKPEFLGKVSLQLSMTAAGLQVKVNADDMNVRNAISGQIQALVETLSSKGVEVTKVEVLYTGVSEGDFMNSQSGNGQPQHSTPSRRYAQSSTSDTAGFDIPPVQETLNPLDDGISSVEYRA